MHAKGKKLLSCSISVNKIKESSRYLVLIFQLSTAMLRIRMLSGEDVASIPVGEVIDVRAMKQRLNALHGLPNRFRQRLICQGSPLDDSATLSSPADLELVLLPHSDATETQVDELVTAAANGSTTEASFARPKPRKLCLSEPSLDSKILKADTLSFGELPRKISYLKSAKCLQVETMLRLPQNPNIVGSQGRSAADDGFSRRQCGSSASAARSRSGQEHANH